MRLISWLFGMAEENGDRERVIARLRTDYEEAKRAESVAQDEVTANYWAGKAFGLFCALFELGEFE
ncbi:MAG: hypothetical protein HC893_00095 [Chloroflexaceae bacterium]|nr:hypothetical protein [Chloroflexaceae bacterium]